MIGKNGTWGEGLDVRRVQILETKATVRYGGQEFIMGKDHRVLCIIEKYMLGFKPTSVKSIYKSD